MNIDVTKKMTNKPIPIHIPIRSMFDMTAQDSSVALLANNASVNAKPSLPTKLMSDKNVALRSDGKDGVIAAFKGAVDIALGQLLSVVSSAIGILIKRCITTIMAICNPAAENSVHLVPTAFLNLILRPAIQEAMSVVTVR